MAFLFSPLFFNSCSLDLLKGQNLGPVISTAFSPPRTEKTGCLWLLGAHSSRHLSPEQWLTVEYTSSLAICPPAVRLHLGSPQRKNQEGGWFEAWCQLDCMSVKTCRMICSFDGYITQNENQSQPRIWDSGHGSISPSCSRSLCCIILTKQFPFACCSWDLPRTLIFKCMSTPGICLLHNLHQEGIFLFSGSSVCKSPWLKYLSIWQKHKGLILKGTGGWVDLLQTRF